MNQYPYPSDPGQDPGQPQSGQPTVQPPAWNAAPSAWNPPAEQAPLQVPPAGFQPVGYVPAPAFVLQPPRDPRLTGAGKLFNRLCLVVLLQTAAAFVIEIPLTVVSMLSGVNYMTDGMAYQLFSAAMVPLSTALPFFVYLKIGNKDVGEYLRFEKVGFPVALLCVLAGLGVCLLGNLPASWVQEFFGGFGYEPASMGTGESSLLLLAVELFSTAVVVPVMEEFAFRGVLVSALRHYGAAFAVVASALVFSLVHMDFSNVLFAFVAGLVFGFLYVRTGNLWVTISIHALNNAIAVISSYEDLLFGSFAETADVLLLVVPIAVGMAALLVLCIWKHRQIFSPLPSFQTGVRPLSAGEGASAVARAPLFWVIVAMMAAYTTTLFF